MQHARKIYFQIKIKEINNEAELGTYMIKNSFPLLVRSKKNLQGCEIYRVADFFDM